MENMDNTASSETAANSLAYQEILAGLSAHTDAAVCLLDQFRNVVWSNTIWGQARRQIGGAGISDWVDVDLRVGSHPVRFGRDNVPGKLEVQRLGASNQHWLLTFEGNSDRNPDPDFLLHIQKLESLGAIAGVVSHDYNNLLTAILGNADLLADDPGLPGHLKGAVQNVVAAAELAAELCQQIMSFSEGDAGSKFGTVDLSELVRRMKHMIQVITAAHADVFLDFTGDGSIEVLGDGARLQQVVLNLLMNATQALTERGSIHIKTGRVQMDESDIKDSLFDGVQPGQYGYVSVSDTGCGISGCQWRRMFDRAYTTKSDGRGMGLAAVASIVEWHRGTVVVRSLETGTEFVVLLPLQITIQTGV